VSKSSKNSTVLKGGQLLIVAKLWRFFNSGLGAGPVQYCRYRQDPVPWTGRSKNGRLFRHPRTTNERRAHFSNEATRENLESYGVAFKVRRKRSPHMLPTAWNDISRLHQRSWKEHRRTQRKNADGIDRKIHAPAIWDRRNSLLIFGR